MSQYIEIEVNLNDPCFDFSVKKPRDKVDWSKLQYTNIYKSFDYFDSRFSGDYSHIPGFDIIIDQMAKHTLTPYEEMQQRISEALLYNEQRNDSNISEFKNCG
jgi:hypothetical protein